MIRPMSSPPHRLRPLARLGPLRFALVALALLLIGLAWWGVLAGARGLESRRLSGANGEPLRFLAPQGATNAPAVIIAHGFSGSTPFMLGFAQPLARAGYGVMLLDFDGHGAARTRLDDGSLQRNLDAAYAALLAQPEIDPARVALLGHSMGSGAVMSAAIADADRYRATVAVSPSVVSRLGTRATATAASRTRPKINRIMRMPFMRVASRMCRALDELVGL